MRLDPRMVLRGLGKFAAVVVAAGLAGVLIGIGLSKLSGNDAASEPLVPATNTSTSPRPARQTSTPSASTTSRKPSTTATTPAAAGTAKAVYRVPRIQVQSAQLGPATSANGAALVAIRVSVTNRGQRPLTVKSPVLLSGVDAVVLGASRRPAAGALLKPIAVGATASGVLRFTVPSAIAQRLTARPAARLRLANRVIAFKLITNQPPK